MTDAGGAVTYRPAVLDDLPACTRIWRTALADYLGRLNADAGLPLDLEPLRRFLAHLLATDPERFVVAVRLGEDRVVGFGSANVRGGVWFLGMLFVEPGDQANGVGRSMLERLMDGSDGLTLGTAADSAQPISNAMYARLGMVPRMPCLNLVGRPTRDAPPSLPAGMRAIPFPAIDGGEHPTDGSDGGELGRAIDSIDRALLGYERPADHAWMRREGRMGWLFRDGERAVGYGYVAPVGRIGPVASLEPELLAPIVGGLLAGYEPAGASSVWVPGHAGPVVETLLRAGMRLEPFPVLMCWTSPIAPFDRYVPISLALI